MEDAFLDMELNLYSKGYDPFSYNANRPLPRVTALYENGGPSFLEPGAEVNSGRAVETNLQELMIINHSGNLPAGCILLKFKMGC